jgi:hypothetical protein
MVFLKILVRRERVAAVLAVVLMTFTSARGSVSARAVLVEHRNDPGVSSRSSF